MAVTPILAAKDPADVVAYGVDFASLLTEFADTISTASVTVSPVGLVATGSIVNGTVVTTVLSGGAAGTTYRLSFNITTVGGYQVTRSGMIPVQNR